MKRLKNLLTYLLVIFTSLFGTNKLYSQSTPDNLLLKNYRPKSIYKVPVTQIEKAKFPVIDMHSHPYA